CAVLGREGTRAWIQQRPPCSRAASTSNAVVAVKPTRPTRRAPGRAYTGTEPVSSACHARDAVGRPTRAAPAVPPQSKACAGALVNAVAAIASPTARRSTLIPGLGPRRERRPVG